MKDRKVSEQHRRHPAPPVAHQRVVLDHLEFLDEGCPCRKPAPGLLLEAQAKFGLDFASSWLVGDTAKDIAAARAAGVRAWLVRSGWGLEEQGDALRAGLPWENIADDLLDATERILASDGAR